MSFEIILIEYIKKTCTCIALNELDNIVGQLIGLNRNHIFFEKNVLGWKLRYYILKMMYLDTNYSKQPNVCL